MTTPSPTREKATNRRYYIKQKCRAKELLTGRPVPKTILPNLTHQLEKSEGYDDWEREVRSILGKYMLLTLLDSKIPRSEHENNGTKAWSLVSKSVGGWLRDNVSNKVNSQLDERDGTPTLAHEIWDNIRNQMTGYNPHADLEMWKSYTEMTASDYPETSTFVREVLTRAAALNEQKIHQSPYFILLKILDGLSAQHSNQKIRILNTLKHNQGPNDITPDKLQEMANEIMHELQDEESKAQTTSLVDGTMKLNILAT
ncbi:uncharacterized protein N7483_004111 [Penicillium malachiteum]|uniref:uncharacterized protein n=1 Tax=Penicillium malachiteum TaxID=1324776 RepID=UPI002547E7A6|nr:uncharacterized protein N7483_004111 [Penicillium malachiteum]KAJ5729603.1 hypothetical protein N7483_004111 [Penicillium malachiteum]